MSASRCYIFLVLLVMGVHFQTTPLSMANCLLDGDAEFCAACLDMASTTVSTTTVTTTTTPAAVTTTAAPPVVVTTAAPPPVVVTTAPPVVVVTTPAPVVVPTPAVVVGCLPGWRFTNRPSGGWCMRVFTGIHDAKIEAERACAAKGGTLTGLQNRDDALFIQRSLLALIPQNSASVWVGIQRTAACTRQQITAACTRTTSFEWTDGSATGTDGFVFQPGQPDNILLNQNCALLLASRTPTITARGTYYAATLEDVNCVATFIPANIARQTRGYACGRHNRCEPGWRFFNRPSGGWCIRVFTGFHAAKADAEAACQAVGATLSGLQNPQEAAYIQSSLLGQIPQRSASVWVGIQRTAACMNQPPSAACSRTTAFRWTDNSATGTAGFVFQPGQPDNIRLNQNCALLLASETPTITARGTYYAATLEDVNCVANFIPENEARRTRGFACGKRG